MILLKVSNQYYWIIAQPEQKLCLLAIKKKVKVMAKLPVLLWIHYAVDTFSSSQAQYHEFLTTAAPE